MQPDEFQIISEIMKMGNAAFIFREITARRGKIDRWHAGPNHPDRDFRIEIETAGATRGGEGEAKRFRGINPEAEKRVVDASAKDFQSGEAHAQLATVKAFEGNFRSEDWPTQHKRGRMGLRRGHEIRDVIGGMLPVGIHREHVSESLRDGFRYTRGDGSAFSAVVLAHDHTDARIAIREGLDGFGTPIGAAVDHHPDGTPLCQRCCNRFDETRSGVIAGNENEVSERSRHGTSSAAEICRRARAVNSVAVSPATVSSSPSRVISR